MRTPEQKAAQARKQRERYAADPEKYKARNKAYYAADPQVQIARAKEYYVENREAIRARVKAQRAANRVEINAREREAHRLNPERKRESGRRWRARNDPRLRERGLTRAVYEAMLELQEGACAICWTPFEDTLPRIDHDHRTGHIRGLLCHHCNVALGLFRDNPDYLFRAIRYVDQQRPSKGEPVPTPVLEVAA